MAGCAAVYNTAVSAAANTAGVPLLASRVCAKGRVRIDGQVVRKAHYIVRIGHVLTFPQARQIRVVRVEGLGTRRGSAVEAQALYTEIGADQAS